MQPSVETKVKAMAPQYALYAGILTYPLCTLYVPLKVPRTP